MLAIATVAVAIVEGAAATSSTDRRSISSPWSSSPPGCAPRPASSRAIAAFVIYNLLFTEPRFTLVVSDPTEWLNLVLFLFVALVIGRLAGIGADRAAEAEARAAESAALYAITRTLATDDPDTALPAVARSLVAGAGMDRVWCVLDEGGAERTVADTGDGPIGPRRAMVQVLMADRGEPAWMRTHGPARPSAASDAPGVERRLPRGPRASTATRSVSKPTASRSAPCGGRAPPIARSRRARETRLLALAAAQVGAGASAGSGSASRPSRPRSRVATRRSRARSSTPSRTTCARRSPASAPPPARSPIPRYERIAGRRSARRPR